VTTSSRLTVAAALAVALASAALLPVFDGQGWLLRVLGGIAAVAGAGALARRARLPRLLHPLAGLSALAAYVCLVFARPTLAYGLLPGGETLRVLHETLGLGLLDVEELAPPVPTRAGLVLLAVLGVGAIAVVVDALAATLRQPAVAGLPLLLLFAVPAAVLPTGLGWFPFVLGAAGWLGLLLVDGSDAVSRWGAPLRGTPGRNLTAPDPGLGRVGRRIGAAALGVAVIVPALVPGLDSRLLGGGTGGGGVGGSRTTTTYNPITELAGQLQLPEPRLLLTYQSEDSEPDYLRLTTLDVFDEDSGWSSSELSADPRDDRVQDGIPDPTRAERASRTPISTTIDVRRFDAPWLPTPFPPTSIDVEGRWLWDAESQTVFSTRTSLKELDSPYTVRSERLEPSVELLRGAPRPPATIVETYAVRPTVTQYVQNLVDQTVMDATTDYDRVAAIQELFRDRSNGFVYDHETPAPGFNSPDALENFLRGKRGFCEQYASAMAAMVRTLGIPARVAVGFTPGTRRATDGVYEVTTNEAHAWPEVWFSGAGWVRFEPTPRGEQVTTPGYTVPPVEVDDPAAPAPDPATAPDAGGSAAPADPGAIDRADDLAGAPGAGADEGISRAVVVGLVAAAVLAVGLGTPALLTQLRRRRRWSNPTALSAWGQVCDDAVDVGHVWRPADSPRAAAAHLAQERSLSGEAQAALERLAVGAERARYARPGSTGETAGTQLHDDARAVRTGLLETAGRGQRWAARLAPPSTLRWASSSLGSATADALDRFDAAVTAVGERVKHPGLLRRRPAA
jgi:transglutaminase-like putative cysteine protease